MNRSPLTPAVLASAAIFFFAGCLGTGAPAPRQHSDEDPVVEMRVGMAGVAALGKSSLITLNRVIIVFSSSANDTVRDTLTSSTTPPLNTSVAAPQNLSKNYTLKALRGWKMTVSSHDLLDSVIHRDSAVIPVLYAGDTAAVNLSLGARYGMYEAHFLTLPDSIRSATPSQPKQALCINRLVLRIDGVPVRDSSASPCFASGSTPVLAFDYVRTASKAVVVSGTSQPLYAVHFPTVDTGYAVGASVALKTVDGGKTWASAGTGGAGKTLRAVHFRTGRNGLVAGGGDSIVIRMTTNGGTAWTRSLASSSVNTIRAMHVVNDTGWAAMSHLTSLSGSYTYYVTMDGGASWTPTAGLTQAYSIRGINGSTAWAVGPNGMIRRLASGGGFFTTVQTSGTSRTLRSVHPVNANLVYAVGDTGTILRTTDGGSSWNPQTSGTSQNLNAVHFLDAATGYAVGNNGTILATLDSGNTWTAEPSPTSANLNGLSFFGSTGSVVGDGGVIFILNGPRFVQMQAHGPMGSWNTALPLYSGSRYIATEPGANQTIPLVLNWTGPTTGTGSLQAQIARVGKVVVNGTVPGTVTP